MKTPKRLLGYCSAVLFGLSGSILATAATPSPSLSDPSEQAFYFELPRLFRPGISFSIRNVETDPRLPEQHQMGWLGIKVDSETALIELDRSEIGLGGHFFNSVAGLSPDAFQAALTETDVHAFIRRKFDTRALGGIHSRISMGYFGNWRSADTELNPNLRPFRGVRLAGDLSTSFDDRLRFGAVASYTFSEEGVLHAGGYLKHRLFSLGSYDWDARLSMDIAVARTKEGSQLLQESWSAFSLGICGAI